MTGGLVALKITHIISWKVIMLAKFRFIIGRMKEEESWGWKIRIMTASGKQREDSPISGVNLGICIFQPIYILGVRLNELFQLNISNLTFIDNWLDLW